METTSGVDVNMVATDRNFEAAKSRSSQNIYATKTQKLSQVRKVIGRKEWELVVQDDAPVDFKIYIAVRLFMEFEFDVNKVLPNTITFVDCKRSPFARHTKDVNSLQKQLDKIIDALGSASSKAQELHTVITTATKLQRSDHELYLLKDVSANEGRGAAVGMIKVGRKTLFLLDSHGVQNEVVPLCVMDFYIHHTKQRNGCGKKLFEHMLKIHNLQPSQVAIDRPSHKFLSFLKKHYGLQNSVSQPNKFLVFDQFFRDMNAVGFVPRRSQRSRSGNQLNNRPPVHPYQRNSVEKSSISPGAKNEEQQKPTRRLSTRRRSSMEVDEGDTELNSKTVLPSIPSREHSSESMRSVGSAGSRESSAHGTRGMAAQASLYSRHSSADVAQRQNPTANQLWKRNAISAGMRSLHACSEDNPLAVGKSFINMRTPSKEQNALEFGHRRPNTIQLKPLGKTVKSDSASYGGSYSVSSVLNSRTSPSVAGNHGTAWNVFGIPPVDTSPKTSYQAKGRTFPF